MNKRQRKKKQKQLEQMEKTAIAQSVLDEPKDTEIKQEEIKEELKEEIKEETQTEKAVAEPVENTQNALREDGIVSGILKALFFPIVIFLFEMVLEFSIGADVQPHNVVYIALFSLSYGLIIHFFVTLTKKKIVNRIAHAVILLLLGFLYCMLYYLFCEFQLFYDLNTMFAGAGDAVTNFSSDIVSIMLTADGIWHLLAFFIGFIFFVCFEKKLYIANFAPVKRKVVVLISAAVFYCLSLLLIGSNDVVAGVYGEYYDYNTAITDFGLMTAIRMELKHAMFSQGSDMAFETISMVEEDDLVSENAVDEYADFSAVSGNTMELVEDLTEQIRKTGENKMDIDFLEMAKKDGGRCASLDEYVASLKPSSKNEYTGFFKGKNLIFITAEAFTAEAIDKRRTPTLYRMANKGIQFTDYYQPASAGTTGGEYANIFGMLPTSGGSSMKKTATHYNWSTIGSRLTEQGYYGKAYHNNSYTYYGRDKTHINLGYSDGYEGKGNGMEDYLTPIWPESDLEMMEYTLPQYIDKQPFNIYYMSVSGHSLYSFGQNQMSKKHREEVEYLSNSEPVKSYLACQIELDWAMEYLIDELEKAGIADDTVIVISADHFPYGLDQNTGALTYLTELYGRSIDNNMFRDHNRLIMWSGCLEDDEPIVVDTPTSSMDILPTLCNLFEVEFDSRLYPGRDVFSDADPLVFSLGYDWKTDKGLYIASKGKFYPSSPEVEIPDGYVEQIKAIVKNKIIYSKGVLQQDYFRHLFGNQ